MNYTTKYNRAQIGVVHPQLNKVISKQPAQIHRTGRKRQEFHKNLQSSGILSQYYLPKQLTSYFPKISYSSSPTTIIKPQVANSIKTELERPQPQLSKPVLSQKQQFYKQQISRLKQKLQQRVQQLQNISKTPEPVLNKNLTHQKKSFDQITKSLFDKQNKDYLKQRTYNSLSIQLKQKAFQEKMLTREKQEQKTRRLQDLKWMRQQEINQRALLKRKAQQYRNDLDLQSELRKKLKKDQQKERRKHFLVNADISPLKVRVNQSMFGQRPYLMNYLQYGQYNKLGFPGQYITKMKPKTLSFDPITGLMRDRSPYIYGPIRQL